MRIVVVATALACALPMPALAAPGLADEVYGATVEPGETEFEAIYGRLGGGAADGADALKLEVGRAIAPNLRIAAFTKLGREAGLSRRAKELAVEAIYHLGRTGGVDFAAYGEYSLGLNGNPDALEAKLLIQRKHGPIDLRLNLIAEKRLVSGAPVEFGYGASADVAATKGVRIGVQAFGELGTAENFLPRAEHFVGPVAKFRVPLGGGDGDEGFGIEAGYLFAAGKARDDTAGQLRIALEMEF